MPGLLGAPAVMTTTSDPAIHSADLAALTMVCCLAALAACDISSALPLATS